MKLDYPAVLWELDRGRIPIDFLMLAYSTPANNLDVRNYENFLHQPYRLGFSEAMEIQRGFLSSLERNEIIEFAEFEHTAFRMKTHVFKIWIIPFQPEHIIITYEDITENRSLEKSITFIEDLIREINELH